MKRSWWRFGRRRRRRRVMVVWGLRKGRKVEGSEGFEGFEEGWMWWIVVAMMFCCGVSSVLTVCLV